MKDLKISSIICRRRHESRQEEGRRTGDARPHGRMSHGVGDGLRVDWFSQMRVTRFNEAVAALDLTGAGDVSDEDEDEQVRGQEAE